MTTVQGLPKKFDQKKILKVIKKQFACNGTIVTDSEMGEVMQMQGDQRSVVHDFLVDKKEGLGLEAAQIKVSLDDIPDRGHGTDLHSCTVSRRRARVVVIVVVVVAVDAASRPTATRIKDALPSTTAESRGTTRTAGWAGMSQVGPARTETKTTTPTTNTTTDDDCYSSVW